MSEAATNPFNSASDSSKFQFYICFRSFWPDFLSVFHGEETVPPQELRIDCNFPCQEGDDELIKIELWKRNVWHYFRKFRTFDMQINFAIPIIFHFSRWLGEFFFPLSRLRNSYYIINQFISKVKNFFRHFTTVPTYTLLV